MFLLYLILAICAIFCANSHFLTEYHINNPILQRSENNKYPDIVKVKFTEANHDHLNQIMREKYFNLLFKPLK